MYNTVPQLQVGSPVNRWFLAESLMVMSFLREWLERHTMFGHILGNIKVRTWSLVARRGRDPNLKSPQLLELDEFVMQRASWGHLGRACGHHDV